MKDIFVTSLIDFENMEIDYNLEFCGMSGRHYGWKWYIDDEAGVNVYFKDNEEIEHNIYDKYLDEY